MKQRLPLVRGLISDPRIVFLDEPTSGLDPVAAHELRQAVTELNQEGRTILLATHDMAEAEQLCTRITIINRGRLLVTEPPGRLVRHVTIGARIVAEEVGDDLAEELRRTREVRSVTVLPDGSTVIETDRGASSAMVIRRLVDAGVDRLQAGSATLEEAYLDMLRGQS
jgi:ABC-2 type transport system ATP-binding protein